MSIGIGDLIYIYIYIYINIKEDITSVYEFTKPQENELIIFELIGVCLK